MQECPVGTFKNVSGSDRALCRHCPSNDLPHRAIYITVRGISKFLLLLVGKRMTLYLLQALF